MKYKITGKVKDEEGDALSGLFVEAFDSDVAADDYLGNSVTDSLGEFRIEFEDKSFKGPFEILERGPDVYLVVRDNFRVIHKTGIRSNSKYEEFFDITVKEARPVDDPYANTFQKVIASFNATGDTVDISPSDFQRLITQMIRALASWSYYTRPNVMPSLGYPGPQVPQYAKREGHKHSLPWHKK
ncbi:MAG: hypothetical protein ACRD38_08775 [Nitrososphaerales archaeon]